MVQQLPGIQLRMGSSKVVIAQFSDGSETTVPWDVVQRSNKLSRLDLKGKGVTVFAAPPGWAESWLHFLSLMRMKQGAMKGKDVEQWNIVDYLRVRVFALHIQDCPSFKHVYCSPLVTCNYQRHEFINSVIL